MGSASSPLPPISVVFMGTSDFACPALHALARQSPLTIRGVVTQPDRPKGRHLRPQPPPVKVAALEHRLPILQPAKARSPDFVAHLGSLHPDLMVVAAYGQILPQAILDIPPLGCLNLHASLLPKHRGAAPIQWAILEGDAESGVTLMKMDAGLDTGDILCTVTTPISGADTAQSLHDRLAQLGADLLIRSLPAYVAGDLRPSPQPEAGVTYARKITRDDGRIDWSRSASAIERQVRALAPWPGATTSLPSEAGDKRLKIWKARVVDGQALVSPGHVRTPGPGRLQVACGKGFLEVEELQLEGGRRLTAGAFLAGHPLAEGQRLV